MFWLWLIIFLVAILVLPLFIIWLLKSENDYINLPKYYRFLLLILLIISYLLPIIIAHIILYAVSVMTLNIYISISAMIGYWIFFVFGIYAVIRLIFSVWIFVYDTEGRLWIKECLNLSINLTKWKAWNIFILALPFVVIGHLIDRFIAYMEYIKYPYPALIIIANFFFLSTLGYSIYLSIYRIIANNDIKSEIRLSLNSKKDVSKIKSEPDTKKIKSSKVTPTKKQKEKIWKNVPVSTKSKK